jgi:hypothetical protein
MKSVEYSYIYNKDACCLIFYTYTHLYLQTCLHVKVAALRNFNCSIGIIKFLIKKRTHVRICKDEFVCRRQHKKRYPFHIPTSSEGLEGEKRQDQWRKEQNVKS